MPGAAPDDSPGRLLEVIPHQAAIVPASLSLEPCAIASVRGAIVARGLVRDKWVGPNTITTAIAAAHTTPRKTQKVASSPVPVISGIKGKKLNEKLAEVCIAMAVTTLLELL